MSQMLSHLTQHLKSFDKSWVIWHAESFDMLSHLTCWVIWHAESFDKSTDRSSKCLTQLTIAASVNIDDRGHMTQLTIAALVNIDDRSLLTQLTIAISVNIDDRRLLTIVTPFNCNAGLIFYEYRTLI